MKKALLPVAPHADFWDSQENSSPDFEKNKLVQAEQYKSNRKKTLRLCAREHN